MASQLLRMGRLFHGNPSEEKVHYFSLPLGVGYLELLIKKNPNLIYIGYDPREDLAFHLARYSILSRTDRDSIWVLPLKLCNLKHILNRPIEKREGKLWCPISQAPMSTEFAISRFSIPFLEHKGWVLFIDCDTLILDDIRDLFALANPQYAIMVVKHNYQPTETTKMDGQTQTSYSRKNWSSVMMWNLDHPSNKNLTLEALNKWPGRDLHAFKWLKDEEIGELPQEWNFLAGINQPSSQEPKLVHYTLGTPNIAGYEKCELSYLWWSEYNKLKQRWKFLP